MCCFFYQLLCDCEAACHTSVAAFFIQWCSCPLCRVYSVATHMMLFSWTTVLRKMSPPDARGALLLQYTCIRGQLLGKLADTLAAGHVQKTAPSQRSRHLLHMGVFAGHVSFRPCRLLSAAMHLVCRHSASTTCCCFSRVRCSASTESMGR